MAFVEPNLCAMSVCLSDRYYSIDNFLPVMLFICTYLHKGIANFKSKKLKLVLSSKDRIGQIGISETKHRRNYFN